MHRCVCEQEVTTTWVLAAKVADPVRSAFVAAPTQLVILATKIMESVAGHLFNRSTVLPQPPA